MKLPLQRLIRCLASLSVIAVPHAGLTAATGHGVKENQQTQPKAAFEDIGLHLLHDPQEPTVTVVAVHGLDGHWRRSWQSENGVFWLRDLLPHVLAQARVYSFGYESRTRWGDVPLTQDIYEHGKDLVASLSLERQLTGTEQHPIIFVGHSLGGIVIKSALLHSDMARLDHLEQQKAIKLSTYGVMFLGTPHQGGQGVRLAQVVTSVLSHFTYTNGKILDQIEPNSDWLQELQSRYNTISRDFETTFFYETWKMKTPVGKLLIVPSYSAVIQGAVNSEDVALAADHSTMAKFPGPGDTNFQKIARRLLLMEKKAAVRIQSNWDQWNSFKSSHVSQPRLGAPLTGSRASSAPAQEFHLGLTLGRLRNTQFTGRETVLLHIDDMLQRPPTRPSLRLAVLYGIGGIGKTQIALEYAYRTRSRYSAIFWIDGSREDVFNDGILRCLYQIKAHYELHGWQDSATWKFLNKTVKEPSRTSAGSGADPPSESVSYRDCFKLWLAQEENVSWLLIIDNVDDLESFNFRSVLPSTAWGSVLLTSRRSDLALNWNAIEVAEMDDSEALELLRLTTDSNFKVNPSEYRSAQSLVSMLAYFPLAISQAGAYIKMQRQSNPISSYIDLYSKQPKALLNHRSAPAAWDYRQDTVLTTWKISYEAIRANMPEAAVLLRHCGFVDPDNIDLRHFTPLFLDETVAQQAFNLLSSYSLLRRANSTRNPGRHFMHPLVHFWVREEMEPRQRLKTSRESLELLYTLCKASSLHPHADRAFDRGLVRNLKYLSSLYHQLLPCGPSPQVKLSGPREEDRSLLKHAAYETLQTGQGWLLWTRSKVEEAFWYLYRTYLTDGPSSFEDWELLYLLMMETATWTEQQEHLRWTLCHARSRFPTKHPRVLEIVGNYAYSLYSSYTSTSEDVRAAYLWYEWLLDARTRVLGPRHPATAGAMIGLGLTVRAEDDSQDRRNDWQSNAPWSLGDEWRRRDEVKCNKFVSYLIAACDLRIQALGYDDVLSQNAMRILAEAAWDSRGHSQPFTRIAEWFLQAIKRAPESVLRHATRASLEACSSSADQRLSSHGPPALELALTILPSVQNLHELLCIVEGLVYSLADLWRHEELKDRVNEIVSKQSGLLSSEASRSLLVPSRKKRRKCSLATNEAVFCSFWHTMMLDEPAARCWLNSIFLFPDFIHNQLPMASACWSRRGLSCQVEPTVVQAFEYALGSVHGWEKTWRPPEMNDESVIAKLLLWSSFQQAISHNPSLGTSFELSGYRDSLTLTDMDRLLEFWDQHAYLPQKLPASPDGINDTQSHFQNSTTSPRRPCPGLAWRYRLEDVQRYAAELGYATQCFSGASTKRWTMCPANQ